MLDTIYLDGKLQAVIMTDETEKVRKYLSNIPVMEHDRFSVYHGETDQTLSYDEYMHHTDPDFETWIRNSFEVKAVRVTPENAKRVAKWCKGSVGRAPGRQTKGRWDDTPQIYVTADVKGNYHTFREAKVYEGDWLIQVDGEFKHYRDEPFRVAFHKKADNQRKKLQELFEQALMVDLDAANVKFDKLRTMFTERAMAIIEGRDEEWQEKAST